MKSLFIFSALFLVLAISTALAIELDLSSSSETPSSSANLIVSSAKYEPYPVEPGELFELWIRIKNDGQQTAKDATCKLVLDNPFSLYQGELIQSYGSLVAGGETVFKYQLRVADNAADRENELKIECSDNPLLGSWKQTKLAITVRTRYPTLNIAKVETEPSAIAPGHRADLLLTFENNADTSMKDISVKIDFSSVPFAPYGEIGEQKLRILAPSESKVLTFSIVALSTAEGGIYKIPINLSYTDNAGNAYSSSNVISVDVNSKPDLFLAVESSEMTTSKKTGLVSLKIINRGLTNIKYMSMKMLFSKQIKLISADTVYIGDVDSDDSETADFRITAKTSKLNIPLELIYRDVNNNPFTEQVNVTYNLPSDSEIGKGGINWPVVLIIIVLIVFIFIKRHKILNWIRRR